MDAQKRMRSANILVIGLNSLSCEVLKNLVLAGVGSLTLADPSLVTLQDLGSEFFLTKKDMGHQKAPAYAARVTLLNPRVKVNTIIEAESYFTSKILKEYDAVVLVNDDPRVIDRIDKACTDIGCKFWAANALGFYGFIFCNLQNHAYTEYFLTIIYFNLIL